MRFYFPQRFPSVLLLLVALTCATQASSLRERRSVWNDIGNTLNDIGQTIKDTVKTGIDSLFHRHSATGSEITQPTLEPEWNGIWNKTMPSEENGLDFRQIIEVPIRCPPNHTLVKDKCRLEGRR
ncbi:hypothetical protein PUN28_003474 [Cardiocondyla obscurior]|uniref:Secapin n=1 Tax=Cardiocondyla obscurior TaxID=286306 RepID=A0AAW2GKP3_9HYME